LTPTTAAHLRRTMRGSGSLVSNPRPDEILYLYRGQNTAPTRPIDNHMAPCAHPRHEFCFNAAYSAAPDTVASPKNHMQLRNSGAISCCNCGCSPRNTVNTTRVAVRPKLIAAAEPKIIAVNTANGLTETSAFYRSRARAAAQLPYYGAIANLVHTSRRRHLIARRGLSSLKTYSTGQRFRSQDDSCLGARHGKELV
jgi:hypothetical protein